MLLDSGLDGRPEIDYDWLTMADYLARYDGTVSLNVGSLVGNSQAEDRPPSGGTICPAMPIAPPGGGPPARRDVRGRGGALDRARLPAGLIRDDR